MNKELRELTNREQALVNLLEQAFAENNDYWVDKKTILYWLSEHYQATDNPNAHDICSVIWSDINKINNYTTYNKIIIIDNNMYKIATEQEARDYIEKKKKEALLRLWRVSKIKSKILNNGQYDMTEEQFIDTFGKEL